MKALTNERWQEIRGYKTDPFDLRKDLVDVLQQHDQLAAQIKLLADYIMNERPDDPAWQHTGACFMAIEIMRREAKEIEETDKTFKWLGEGYDDPPASRDK